MSGGLLGPPITRRRLSVGGLAFLSAGAAARERLTVRTYTAGEEGMAVNSHLVTSGGEAVLIDAQFLISDARAVADLVERSGARLRLVFFTHPHPDHVFGAAVLRQRFPQTRFVARPDVAGAVAAMAPVGMRFMRPEFGAKLPAEVLLPEPWTDDFVSVGGRRLRLHTIATAEAALQTVLIDDARTELFAGDVLYSGTHLYLGDRAYAGWRAALDELARIGAPNARPGHGPPGRTQALIAATRRYIDDFERIVGRESDRAVAERALRSLYPRHRGARLLRLSLAEAIPSST